MSAYELDTLPILWRNVLFKNAHFCEHVCHSWLTRSQRLMVLSSNGIYKPEPTDYEFVQKEALRLEEMLDGLIEGIKKKGQIIDSKAREQKILFFVRKNYLAKFFKNHF
uniref:Uncharacterized protein n=1 Tax=Heterorhabditis bacteriophora TaxID=37862 RepID=A0A1I7WE61_HETBA